MKNPLELLQFGKEISETYIKDNIPLTESLTKIAQANNLNKNEMYRVAETANVETYLKMVNKADNGYVEFPLASVEDAYGNVMAKTASENTEENNEDYSDVSLRRQDFSFSMYQNESEETIKTAENVIDKAAIINQLDALNGTLEFISNSLMEETVKLAQSYDVIFSMTKQAMLSDNILFEDINNIIKLASPTNSNRLASALVNDLSKIMPLHSFEKNANYIPNTPNQNSNLFKNIINYDLKLKHITKIANAFSEYEERFDTLNTEHKLGIQKKANSLLNKDGALGTFITDIVKNNEVLNEV